MYSVKLAMDNEEYENMIVPPRLKRMIELLDEFKPKNKENLVILEYGAGSGLGAKRIKEKVPTCELILADIRDYRKDMKNEKFIQIDPSNSILDLEDKSIDVIFTSEVLEHVQNLTQVLLEFHRVLKDDGVIIVSTPNYDHFKVKLNHFRNKLDRLGGRLGDGGHINYITRAFFRQFIENHFTLIKESGDIDLLPISNLLAYVGIRVPKVLKIVKKPCYLYKENSKLNKFSYNYLRVMKKK